MNSSILVDSEGRLLLEAGNTAVSKGLCTTNFPTTALDPDGRVVSILVTPDGRLVTDLNPKPTSVLPLQQAQLGIDDAGKVLIV